MSEGDLHDLPPNRFRDHVRSFEFWFGSVQGYLEGREYGHRPELPAPHLGERARDALVTALCNYCVGETMALDGASGLVRIAPDRQAKIFLSTQTVDEGRHLEVLIHRIQELGVLDVEAEIARRVNPELLRFRERLLDFVDSGDWDRALFAQNVVLEAMEFAVFHRHARHADAITREVLFGIIKDERRHIGFGENELGRRLLADPARREPIREVRAELDGLVMRSFEHALAAIDAPAPERDELSQDYRNAVARLGLP